MKDTLRECIEEGGEGRPDRSALGQHGRDLHSETRGVIA